MSVAIGERKGWKTQGFRARKRTVVRHEVVESIQGRGEVWWVGERKSGTGDLLFAGHFVTERWGRKNELGRKWRLLVSFVTSVVGSGRRTSSARWGARSGGGILSLQLGCTKVG